MLGTYFKGVRSTLLVLAAFALYAYSALVQAESLTLSNYQLISKTHVADSANNGNDNYEYLYRADLSNTGSSVYDAEATVSSTLPQIEVIKNNLTFGLVLAGQTVTSSDTFTIHAKNSFDTRLAGKGSNPPLLVWTTRAKTDTILPTISGESPKDGFVTSPKPVISAQYQDAESGVDVSKTRLLLDGNDITGKATVTTGGINYQPDTALAEGSHTLGLTVTDRIGNSASTTWSFTVDSIPPVISGQAPVDGSVQATSRPTISAQYQDAGGGVDTSKVQLTVDGNPVTANIASTGISYQPATALAQGNHTIALTVVDRAGNRSQASWSFRVNIQPITISLTPDSTPAGIAATAVVTALITDPSVIGSSIVLQKLDAQGRVQEIGTLRDDGLQGDAVAHNQIFTLSFSIYEQNPGSFTYRVAVMLEGLSTPIYSNLAPFTISGTVGTGITLTQPLDQSFVNLSPIIVSGTVSDPNASVTINGIPASISGGSFQASVPLQEGINPLTAVAVNSNGSNTTASVQVTLDTTPPKVTVISPVADATTTEPSVTITGIVNDLVVGTVNDQQARVTVNGINAQVTNRTYTAPDIPLQLGVNTLRIVGTDRTGNSATISVNVTRTAVSGTYIKMISGNNQTGPIATPLAAPLRVQILNGVIPVPNAPVIFKVTQSDGSLQPGAPQSSIIIVNTDAEGKAQANLTLGNRAGAGNNLVEAYSTAATGVIPFTASATPKQAALISVDSGNNQFGAVNQKLVLPFVAVVTDAGFNRLGGQLVTFMIKQGFGTFNGASTWKAVTDSDGRALATLTLGSQPGQDNNVVEAYVTGNESGFPAAFTASGRVPGDPANTRISGVVLDNSNQPIPNVTMRLYQANLGSQNNVHTEVATPVTTDATGHFTITHAPVGLYKLMADGNTSIDAGKLYPTLEYDIVTVAGQDNTVGMPIYLAALDPLAKVCVNETTGGTLTVPSSPGFALTIQPGAATFPGGAKAGCVSVTTVNIDKIPMAPGFGQQPRYIVTIQPVGATFNPPAAITIPNVDGLAPRAKTEMYSYDHDLAAFVAIGSATVSGDGSLIVSDPGIGVSKAGWHCGGNPNSTGSVGSCATCKKCEGSGCGIDLNKNDADCEFGLGCGKCFGGDCKVNKFINTPTCCGGVKHDNSKQCCIHETTYGTNEQRKRGVTIANLGLVLANCPNRKQTTDPKILPENNGCSATPWNYIAAALGIFESFDPNNPTGEANTVFGNDIHDDNGTPCGAHDFCYQSCLPTGGKTSCDEALLGNMGRVCGSVPANQTIDKIVVDELGNTTSITQVNVQKACFGNADLYFLAVVLAGGGPYDDGQRKYCDCCGIE